MEKADESLAVALRAMGDESLRNLITYAMNEHRRRMHLGVVKCSVAEKQGKPSIIITETVSKK